MPRNILIGVGPAVRAAEIAYNRSVAQSAIANGQSPAASMNALAALGVGLYGG
jgi:hypothetical protein